MYEPSTHLVFTYFPTYIYTLILTQGVTEVKPHINLLRILLYTWIEVHPRLSHNGHPVLVGAGWWVLVHSGTQNPIVHE
jgi:hypothetical protein